MSTRYLVRFDDICSTMDWSRWEPVEAALHEYGIRPIVAVVADNRDPDLDKSPARADFWARVRGWQAKGWFIAVHGWQHRYVTHDAGLLGINPFSEFAGLPYEDQRGKLQSALAVFRAERVTPDGWVAPGHSFDAATVRALRELGISVISDGFYRRPVRHLDATWLPQQLWRFRPMPRGVWTVCLHTNTMSFSQLDALRSDFRSFAQRIRSAHDVLREGPAPDRGLRDVAFEKAWRLALRLKRRGMM